MIELLFELLNQIGFTHPLHPAATHLPMGMTMGAFIFGLGSLKLETLGRTAHHCTIVALLFLPPAAIAGVMDWQHFHYGEWSGLIIIKMVLAAVLAALLGAAIVSGRSSGQASRFLIATYALSLLVAVALGFAGGEIQYG